MGQGPSLQPKYQQLSERILRRIENGEWATGDRLPSEVLLAKEYGVAYMTVRAAVSALVKGGRLRRIRGRGTFVAEPLGPDASPVLGLLLPPFWYTLDPFYFPPIVTAFVERAEARGYQVHLGDRSAPLLEYIRLRELNVGAVACVMITEQDVLEAEGLLDRGVAVVAINHYRGSRRIASVSPDNRGGTAAAARALIDLGHTRFAYLAGWSDNLDSHQRVLGMRDAIREAGLPARSLKVIPEGFTEESGYQRAKALIKSRRLPTALLAGSDLAAIGAMKAFLEAGIRIPEEVSIMGFGDFRPAAYLHPSLSTVHLPLEELGTQACDLLIDELAGKHSNSLKLDCTVLLRESVTTPK